MLVFRGVAFNQKQSKRGSYYVVVEISFHQTQTAHPFYKSGEGLTKKEWDFFTFQTEMFEEDIFPSISCFQGKHIVAKVM